MPLLAFAEHEYSDVAIGGWLPHVARIQETARLTANARTLDLAAVGVATMARGCGACHAASGRGPEVAAAIEEPQSQDSTSLAARMGQHMWAAKRLWEGLVGPSDDAWNAGASTLARISTDVPTHDPQLSAAFVFALLETQSLGQSALEATSQDDRASVYGVLLAKCAACHSQNVAFDF